MVTSSVLDHRFVPKSGQTKGCKIDICYFLAKYAALMRYNKDWLARNQDNGSEGSDNSARRLLFQ